MTEHEIAKAVYEALAVVSSAAWVIIGMYI